MLDWIQENLDKLVTVPVFSNIGTFALVLVQSLSDGVVTDDELHAIVQASSGLTLFMLTLVLAVLKFRK